MKVLELHPDDLIDKQLAGTLSAEERVRLDTHIEQCSACQLECSLRADFDAELGPRTETPSVRLLVAEALKQPAAPTVTPMPRRKLPRIAIALCAALCLTGMAAAKSAPVQAALRNLAAAFVPEQSAPSDVAPPVIAARAPAASAVVVPPVLAAPVLSVDAPATPTSTVAPMAAAHDATLQLPAPKTADALFGEARALRSAGRMEEAERAYAGLIAQYPGTSAANTALVVSARMHLDQGNAGLALSRYNAYLHSTHRALREDALAGRALALTKLERTDEAARAWDDLLGAYPNSSYAKRAPK
jgi:tetratricopeptide (TPR) repeat protein